MSKRNKRLEPAPVAPAPEAAPAEPRPKCGVLPTRGQSLCAIVGCVTWKTRTSAGGAWQYEQCANPLCARIENVRPA